MDVHTRRTRTCRREEKLKRADMVGKWGGNALKRVVVFVVVVVVRCVEHENGNVEERIE